MTMDPRSAYRESAARGTSPVGQVVLLYEQVVDDLRRAERALEAHQVEQRTHAINHALLIVGHLQSKLNRNAGGEVAGNLDHFYSMTRRYLLEAQLQSSNLILTEQIGLWLDLRDAWNKVNQAEIEKQSTEPNSGGPPGATTATRDWSA